MKKDKETILSIATRVRAWAERYAERHGFNHNLRGVCAIASSKLHRELKEIGIDTTINLAQVNSNCHVFLTVDGFILDVTATQFSKETFYRVREKVILTERKKVFKYWFWNEIKTFSSTKELIEHQISDNWYFNQIARA